jgi:hypothetical protein
VSPRGDRRARVEWAVAQRALPGEELSGDQCVVASRRGVTLLAVFDGLGHGPGAAAASDAAARVLRAHADEDVVGLAQRCHAALEDTRGVVMSLAAYRADLGTLSWLGVGNVEGLLVRLRPREGAPRESLLLRSGVIGYRLPPLASAELAVSAGDLLVFATDGIDREFAEEVTPVPAPRHLAARILDQWGKPNDDALVLAARFLGDGA